MTLLVTSITGNTVAELQLLADKAFSGGADAVELRIDAFKDEPGELAGFLARHRDRTWIVTCRASTEGGQATGTARDRLALLLSAVSGTDAYIDFEWMDWQPDGELHRRIRERLKHAGANEPGSRLILSMHEFERSPAKLAELAQEIVASQGAVAKVAYQPSHIADGFEALDVMHRFGGSVVAIGMGEAGMWTRILARKLGAFASYCSLTHESATAPGQLTLREMLDRYRWNKIGPATRVYGVIGDPIGQSMGPLLFNRWFADMGIDAVYLPLRVSAEEDGLSRFLDGCVERSWLDIGGLSVTHPHKTAILPWIGKGADRTTESVGALNTLVFGGRNVRGYNTDCQAAIASLVAALQCSQRDLRRLPVDLLGTGGVALALLSVLTDHGCPVTLYGRSVDRGSKMATRFGCRFAEWTARFNRTGAVLINCTPIGMTPDSNDSPMTEESLKGCTLVFDTIYNPLETRLLRQARSARIAVLGGLDMFVRQAAMQFELWTGLVPDARTGLELTKTALTAAPAGKAAS